MHTMNDFISAYADMCEEAKESDVWQTLMKKYNFNSQSEISRGMADKIIEQVETWYNKKKEADA